MLDPRSLPRPSSWPAAAWGLGASKALLDSAHFGWLLWAGLGVGSAWLLYSLLSVASLTWIVLAGLGAVGAVGVRSLLLRTERLGELVASLELEVEEQLQSLEDSESDRTQLVSTLQSVGEGLITTDAEGRVRLINSVAESLTGWSHQEARGKPLASVFRLVDPESGLSCESPVAKCLSENRIVSVAESAVLVSRSGRRYQLRDTMAPLRSPAGGIDGTVLTFSDATDDLRELQEARHEATHDGLTGLLNRKEFERRVANTIKSAREHGGQHAIVYFDLDRFKNVNDAAGHLAGDALLRGVANMLSSRLRSRDSLARMGGDEFAVLLEHCPVGMARQVAESMLDGLRKLDFLWEGRSFDVSASMGLRSMTGQELSVTQLLRDADAACYQAKGLGKNQVSVFCPVESSEYVERYQNQLACGLREALETDGFELYLQPIFAREGELGWTEHFAHEVLLRFREGPETLSAENFLPMAERLGLMPEIDRWVVARALETLDGSGNTRYWINLSQQTLGEATFVDFAAELLERSSLRPDQVCFELPASAVVSDVGTHAPFLHGLKRLGCEIALDQFGSEQSPDEELGSLPIDYLKIDGTFVAGIRSRQQSRTLVRDICELGSRLQLQTIAEAVEDQDVADELGQLGVDYAQGFALARPEPSPAFRAQLR